MRLRHLGRGIELGFLVQNRRKRKKKKKMSGKKAVKEKNTKEKAAKEKNTKVKAAKETLDRQLEEKRSLAGEIIRRLELEYPDAGCTLDYNQAWKLLVSVRLAAQCTDARVNVVVQELYKSFRTFRRWRRRMWMRSRRSSVPADLEEARRGISVPA